MKRFVLVLVTVVSLSHAQGFEKFRDSFTERKLPVTLNEFPLLAEDAEKPFPFREIPEGVTKLYLGNLSSSPYFAYRVALPYGYLGLITYNELSLGCCNNNSYEIFIFDAAGTLKDQAIIAHDYRQKDTESGAEKVHDLGISTIDLVGKITISEEYWLWNGKQKSEIRTSQRTLVLSKDGRLEEGK